MPAAVGYLEAVSFVTVRDHARHPRLRLDLQTTVTWREDVEGAWERLVGWCGRSRGWRQAGAVPAHRCGSGYPPTRSGSRIDRWGCPPRGQVQPLDGGHHSLGDDVPEDRIRQPRCVPGMAEVAELQPHRRHPGAAEQVPGLLVRAAVEQVGPGRQLALQEVGEAFPTVERVPCAGGRSST